MNAPQLPAHLQKYAARDIGQTLSHNLGTAAPPYVSIAGNRFVLIDAAGNEMLVPTFDPQIGVYLDAVIIDANEHLSRIYYASKYDPSAATFNPPDCWSDNGVGPSVSCSSPQARSCTPDPEGQHGCKWAVWGSGTSAQGKAIPACQQVQKLALMVPGVPNTLFLLRVPPNSHKHLRAYQETCRGSGIMVADVITRIYFDQSTQGTLLFKGVNYIDEPTAVLREAAYVEKKTDGLVGRTDTPRPALAAPAVQQAITGPNTMQAINGPFASPAPAAAPQTMMPTTPQGTTGFGQPSAAFTPTTPTAPPAGTAPTASPSDGAPAQRRRRRTQAEMQAAAGAPATGQALQQPASAPQAPFPVAGQPAQTAAAAPASTFGIGQASPANPELTGMLDSFFAK